AIRIPGVSPLRLPSLRVRLPRDAGNAIGGAIGDAAGRAGRRVASAAPAATLPSTVRSTLHLGAPSPIRAAVLPRVSPRVGMIAFAAFAGIAIALLLIQVSSGASDSAAAARELAAARDAIVQREAKIASLEGAITTRTQEQSALQSSAESAQGQVAALTDERDAAKQRVGLLEAELMQTKGDLKDEQARTAKQQAELKTLSTCLNGTAVGLAFGRTNRWSSADVALAAVADSCKAAESLLQR
ncbi:MAG: hypothetical protein O2822_03755, partial [Chloroflexi bacterium]|nr:hypothetical protein [Chloroflexota bacterium]